VSLRAAAAAGVLLALAVPARGQWVAPYKDVSQHADPAAPRIAVRDSDGALQALPTAAQRGSTLVWAFATGECGRERWGPFDTERFAALNVAAFVAAGTRYVLSTGGEAGSFSCDSDEGFAAFIARYDSPWLAGVDFDIERDLSDAQIDALAARAATLEHGRPALRISFTLATHAGSDAAARSLNPTGRRVLAAMRRHGLKLAIVNMMVMNYGPADRRWCRLRESSGAAAPACDMGRSALQAATNLHRSQGLPYRRIALTAMLGENDVAGNVFTLADAALLRDGARRLGLAGVHWWSLDRDRSCEGASPRVSPGCHGLPGVAAGRFGEVFGDLVGDARAR
jgi:hypothetical protein